MRWLLAGFAALVIGYSLGALVIWPPHVTWAKSEAPAGGTAAGASVACAECAAWAITKPTSLQDEYYYVCLNAVNE